MLLQIGVRSFILHTLYRPYLGCLVKLNNSCITY